MKWIVDRRQSAIAIVAVVGIVGYLVLRYLTGAPEGIARLVLLGVLGIGGIPLVLELGWKLIRMEFGSDLLAGISIVTAMILGEYLAGALVVLMLSGGGALEAFAVHSASSVLRALAKRLPSVAHRKEEGRIGDVCLKDVKIGDFLVVFPHEICPVDGAVIEGRGRMDESYLTGEPFQMAKTPGSEVLSGSINGESAITIRATRVAEDSRYGRIMRVMKASEKDRPRLRRLGDKLGAFYTPVAIGVALAAWAISGQGRRFLAVLVVATPCPLLIAIPVAIIGAISLAARRGIVIKKPAVLEQVDTCSTIVLDKTGTLTYGEPRVSDVVVTDGYSKDQVLGLGAALERYSKHPLAGAVLRAAVGGNIPLLEANRISEKPGEGLEGEVDGKWVKITSRKKLGMKDGEQGGLECVVMVDGVTAGTMRFRDEPRADGASFVGHLRHHGIKKVMLVSGDREAEVKYLAERVGISEVYAGKSPEEKLEIVKAQTQAGRTLYVGDGINDAPALLAATVGVAMGQSSDILTEAAGAVITDCSLKKVDEFLHISRRMRRIALQSALGGMGASILGMMLAAMGWLPPVAGAVTQEVIDVIVVLNALRAAMPPTKLSDF